MRGENHSVRPSARLGPAAGEKRGLPPLIGGLPGLPLPGPPGPAQPVAADGKMDRAVAFINARERIAALMRAARESLGRSLAVAERLLAGGLPVPGGVTDVLAPAGRAEQGSRRRR